MIAEATKFCSWCKKAKPASDFHKNRKQPDGLYCYCKECSNARQREYRRGDRAKANAIALRYRRKNRVKFLAYDIFRNAKRNAKKRGLSFGLTRAWFVEKVDAGVCELTGIPFVKDIPRHPCSPSPDRIDNDIGYEDDNGRMILWWLNRAKGTMSEDQFQRCIADLVGAMRDRV